MKIENMLLALSTNGQNSAGIKGNKYEENFLAILDTELNSESDLGEIKKSNVRSEVNVVDKNIAKDENIDESLIEIIASLFNNIKAIEEFQKNEEVNITNSSEFINSIDAKFDKEVFNLKEMPNDNVIKSQLVSMGLNEDEIQIVSDKLNEVITSNIKITNKNNSYSDKHLDIFNYRDNNNFIMKNKLENISSNNTLQNNSHFERLSGKDKIIENEIIINFNINNRSISGFEDLELTFNKNSFLEEINIKNEVSNELNILNKIAFTSKDIDISTNNSNSENKHGNILFNENLNEVKTNLIVEDTSVNEVDIEVKSSFSKDITQNLRTEESYTAVNLNINNKVIMNESNKSINDIQLRDIRSSYVTEDIVQAVEYLNSNNIEELSVKMNPKDLGEINIKLIKTKSEEKCIITLVKEESFNLLKENINEIKTHLSSLEINIKEISVEIRSDNQNDFSDNLNQHFNKNNTKEERRNNRKVTQENERVKDYNEESSNIDLIV